MIEPALLALALTAFGFGCTADFNRSLIGPANPKALPANVSLAQSHISVGDSMNVSGTSETVTLTVADANGNPVPVSGLDVTFLISGGTSTGTFGPVTDNGNGTYTATFTGVLAGTASEITATLNENTLTAPPPQVRVLPGNLSLSNTTVTVASATDASGVGDLVILTTRDLNGNQLTWGGLAVAFANSGGTSTGGFGPVTDLANGTYTSTFTGAIAGTPTSIGATIDLSAVTSTQPTVTVVAGAVSAAVSTVVAAPSPITADGVSTSTVTVTLMDALCNRVSGKTVTLSSNHGASDTISTITGVTGADGQASFTVKSIVAETSTFTAIDASDAVTVTQAAAVTFKPGSVSVAVSTVAAAPSSVASDGVTTSIVTVTLLDAFSNVVPGKTVTLASSHGGSDTIATVVGTTNASGQATFTVKSIVAETSDFTATDTTDSLVITQTAPVTFLPGPVSITVSTISAAPPSIVADGMATSTITVTLKDANANVVSGKTVTLSSNHAGSDTIATITGVTNASGQASFTVKSIVAETSTLTAVDSTDTLTVTPTANVTFVPGAVSPTVSTLSSAPGMIIADGMATSTITVTLKDANSNVVPGKTVTLSSNHGVSDTIATLVGVTNASGQATFTVKSLVVETSAFTALDSTDSITVSPTASVIFKVGPVTAAASTVASSPGSVIADGSSASTVTVTLMDAENHPVSGKIVTLASNHGGSDTIVTLSGTTNASGQATFSVTSLTVETSIFTATDTTDSVTVTQAANVIFTVGPVSAGTSTVSAAPGSVVADGATTSTITVTLLDAESHPVTGKTVTLASSNGASDTIATLVGTTNASGQATFTAKSLIVETSAFTATDTTDSVTVTQTANVIFTVGPVSAGTSTVSASLSSITADGATASTITVTLLDAESHPISGKAVSLASNHGVYDTINTLSGTTNASGQATFTVKSLVAETSIFTATDTTDPVTVTQTASVTFTPGPVSAGVSTVSSAPGSIYADGTTTSTITVTLKDANSNAVSGKTVTLASNHGGSDTIATLNGTTNISGQATFSVKSLIVETSVFTATDTTDALTVTQTASVAFTVGPVSAGNSNVGASVSPITADGVATSTITVTLWDAEDHPVSGKTVTLASNYGGADTISTLSGTTNGSGQATFSVKSTEAKTSVFTATDATDSITITPTASVVFNPGTVSAGNSTVSASPSSIIADNSTTSTITVTLYDVNFNTVPGKTVSLGSNHGGSDTIDTISGTTNGSGQATFTVSSGTAETSTFTATDATDSITVSNTAAVTFNPSATLAFTVPGGGSQSWGSTNTTNGIQFTLENVGTTPTSTISTSIVGTNSAQWSSASDTCNGTSLGGGESCTVQLNFLAGQADQSAGSYAATFQAAAATGGTVSISMSGTAAYTWETEGGSCPYKGDTTGVYSYSYKDVYANCVPSTIGNCSATGGYYCTGPNNSYQNSSFTCTTFWQTWGDNCIFGEGGATGSFTYPASGCIDYYGGTDTCN